MAAENYQIVIGVVVAILILLLAGFFILILVNNSNNRKKRFLEERRLMEAAFNDQLLKSQLEMQEHTFNTISHEIHDNVGQVLSLTKVQLNIIDEQDFLDRTVLLEAKENVGRVMNDLRDIAKSLNSDRIRSGNLEELIGQELKRLERTRLIRTDLTIEGEAGQLFEQKKLILFRVVQEALQNVIKHAKATEVCVHCQYGPDALSLRIADDGIGFQTASPATDGLGLQNIVRRAGLIGGNAAIESFPGQGTSILITSPYD